jgi:hypothetical protein
MHASTAMTIWLGSLALWLSACASTPQVSRIDMTEVKGLFVLVYALDPAVRLAAEQQIVNDLHVRNMTAYASHADLHDLDSITPLAVASAARARRAAAILVVNQVTADGAERVVADPGRIAPEHPDLQSFFAYARDRSADTTAGTADPSLELIAEANLFLLQDVRATLFWSGAAWTRAADGPGGLQALSQQITDALQRAQRELLGH